MTMNLYSHAAVIHRCEQHGERLEARIFTTLEKKNKKPEVQVQMLKLDNISEVFVGITYYRVMLLRERNNLFRWTVFPYLLSCIDVQRQKKTSIDVLLEATIDEYWNIDGEKSLPEPWIDVTRFELLTKKPPE